MMGKRTLTVYASIAGLVRSVDNEWIRGGDSEHCLGFSNSIGVHAIPGWTLGRY